MKTEVHSQVAPEGFQYNTLPDGTAEVWIRQSIREEAARSEGEGNTLEYVYDEIYFRTNIEKEVIKNDILQFAEAGSAWELDVPMTKEEKQRAEIEALKARITESEAAREEDKVNSDMAIAELTMVMAAMMGGEA